MARAIDVLSVVLLVGAAGAFAMGIRALAERDDLLALYLLLVGGLCLRAASDLLRPKSGAG